MSNKYLPYIEDNRLIEFVGVIVDKLEAAIKSSQSKLDSNVIDPFSAVFDACIQNITLSDWIVKEKTRQIQKTMQNQIGTFHENILGSVKGWQRLDVGHVIDLVNYDRKIIAEVKNKYNTTKGNHKKEIYDDLQELINSLEYKKYTGYYVEIIPKNKKEYDKPFVPSDNRNHSIRRTNEFIRVIDGKSFYNLVTGYDNAFKMLYESLPRVLFDNFSELQNYEFIKDPLFSDLFQRAYN